VKNKQERPFGGRDVHVEDNFSTYNHNMSNLDNRPGTAASADEKPYIEFRNITKLFGATTALDEVSFTIGKGQICGLVGENGSGKSTLSLILAGILPRTAGQIILDGEDWDPQNILAAQKNGVAMIVQETGTLSNITVAENLFLGQEMLFRKGLFIRRNGIFTEAQKILDKYGITDFRAETSTAHLDAQQRKLLEIAKGMYWKPRVFIVDETTTALSHSGRELLYRVMNNLKAEGSTVIFISHDLDEMMQHCDALNVLRDGHFIGSLQKEDFEEGVIKQMMVGRTLTGHFYRSDYDGYSDEVVLKADCITTLQDLLCFDLELHKGEILGIGGLSNCGMHTIGRALFGIDKVLDGEVRTADSKIIKNSKTAIASGIGYLSKDRDTESLGLLGTIRENIQSTGYIANRAFGPFISSRKERAYVKQQVDGLSIKIASQNHLVATLSGGNKQKVVFGKWIAADSQILIMDCPTRGVDVGVKAAMYQLMYDMKKAGKSILLISEELPELIGMSDRILIMKDGKVVSEVFRNENPNEQKLIEAMI